MNGQPAKSKDRFLWFVVFVFFLKCGCEKAVVWLDGRTLLLCGPVA